MSAKKLFTFLAAAATGIFSVIAATPGPLSNFDKNALWSTPNINSPGVVGSATRGVLYYDMSNDLGTIDRLSDVVCRRDENGGLSEGQKSELQQVLAIARVFQGDPECIRIVEKWIRDNLSSPHRADMILLLADLHLESAAYGTAAEAYKSIDIDSLSPDLRADYLYHKALCDLMLADLSTAHDEFDSPELRGSLYGGAANFYVGYIHYVDGNYKDALRAWENTNTESMPGCLANYYRSQIAYYEGKYDEAIKIAKPLLGDTGINPLYTAEANRIVGESLYQKGDPKGAIPYLKKYIGAVETPERSSQYILGLAYYEEGDYKKAVESLTPVTTDQSAMGQSAYLYIGQALLKLGDDTSAIMAFNRALSMDFDHAVTEVAYYNYAVAKSRGGNVPFASSVQTFEDFLARFPNSRFADNVAGYIVTGYVTDGNYEAALKSINKIKNPSDKILGAKQKVLYTLGAKLMSTDKADVAVQMLKEAKELGKYDKNIASETNLLLGEALYRTGQYDQSADELLEYIASVTPSSQNYPMALYDLGYTRMAQKDWADAAKNFERVIDNPGNLSNAIIADAQARLGDARYYQRNWAGAASAYHQAYALNTSGGDYPLYQKAVMQGYNADYKGKLETLDELIRSFPTSAIIPDAMLDQADAYVQLKQNDEANAVYIRLMEQYPQTTQGRQAYLYLAADLAANDKVEEAIETYQELIQMASTSEEAHLADEAVKYLHAQQGTLNEYAEFLSSIEGAPTLDSAETELLSWNAAERNYIDGRGTALLEKFVSDYPYGRYTARGLAYLLQDSEEKGDDDDSYKWASQIVAKFPDNAVVEDALITKAEIEYEQGRGLDALNSWETLEQKASTPENKNLARIGILRIARDTDDADRMMAMAEALLSSTTLGLEERNEALFSRALAYQLNGNGDKALSEWEELAENPDDLYGAKSAVFAAETLLEEQRYAEAEKIADKFVNSDTPHSYWLARGFIALSDAYAAQNREFEAQEYLKALKENYPGDEADIFEMIKERLK